LKLTTEIVRVLDGILHGNTVQGQCSVLLIVTNDKDESSVDSDNSKSRKNIKTEELKNMQPTDIIIANWAKVYIAEPILL